MKISVLGLGLLCLALLAHTSFASGFNPRVSHAPHYTKSQLYQTNVGFESVAGTIGCYGDWNNDK